MFKKIRKLILLGLALFSGWYVGTRIEFEDPYAPSPYFNGTHMSEAEIKADPLKAISMTQEAAHMQYDTFEAFAVLLDKYDIDYWITCGTLLGAVRHEAIIAYDDDIDICIHEKDGAKVLALRDDLKKVGLAVYQDRTSIKVYKIDGPYVHPKKRSFKIMDGIWFVRRKVERFPTIDVYITKEEKGEIIHANHRARKSFYKEIYKSGDIYPLKIYQFGHLRVKGPKYPYNFFTSAYGSSWNEKLIYYGSHISQSGERLEFDLTPELREELYRFGAKKG